MKKLSVQFFCQCKEGRAFIVTTSKKSVAEWKYELVKQGWVLPENPYGKASACPICKGKVVVS